VPSFRYETAGPWYKGNLHIHSTASDGGKTFAELEDMYAGAGYDFLFRTDHWVASDVAAEGSEPEDDELLWMDGIELDGPDGTGANFHVVCLGRFTGLGREMGLEAGMAAVREQGGLTILAHPHWCGNSFDDALRHDFDGVEVYNHVCRWLNGKGDGGAYWSAMLDRRPGTLAMAVDDAHLRPEHPGWNGGWVMVNAPARTREAIAAAIRAGNYYCSRGPEFRAIGPTADGAGVTLVTSPVRFIRLVGPTWCGQRIGSFGRRTFTKATFEIPPDWAWAYLEIEDSAGRRAWTNTLLAGDGRL